MVCTRCKTLMYPGERNSTLNHAKGYCSDGAPVKYGWQGKLHMKEKNKIPGPPWPQPQGIFVHGDSFHPLVFLSTLHNMFIRVFVEAQPASDLQLEYEAFAALLHQRAVVVPTDGSILFDIPPHVDIVFPSHIPDDSRRALVVQHAGRPHLRLDCLRDTTNDIVDEAHSLQNEPSQHLASLPVDKSSQSLNQSFHQATSERTHPVASGSS